DAAVPGRSGIGVGVRKATSFLSMLDISRAAWASSGAVPLDTALCQSLVADGASATSTGSSGSRGSPARAAAPVAEVSSGYPRLTVAAAADTPSAIHADGPGARSLGAPRAPLALVAGESAPVQLAARRKAAADIDRCLAAAWEPSTRSRYDATLRSVVSTVESDTAMSLLPCDTEEKVMVLFAGMIGQPWGTVGAAKAAVRAWHVERDLLAAFDLAWTPRAWHFWRGLKKLADHSLRHAKRPLSFDEARVVQRCRLAQASDAGLRDAAMVATAFFGIRRFAEVQGLLTEDVVFQEDAVECRIRRQKNDPCGVGMLIWLPRLPELGPLCPLKLMQSWAARRAALWPASTGY
ncbi:unnamed protein product, partial [Prorocentrum cordatum]